MDQLYLLICKGLLPESQYIARNPGNHNQNLHNLKNTEADTHLGILNVDTELMTEKNKFLTTKVHYHCNWLTFHYNKNNNDKNKYEMFISE